MRTVLVVAATLLISATAHAQFQMQNSHTTANLRGIHSLGDGIAWASGTEGTVLRTTDGGANWQRCTTPRGAEKLDFRGIQAFDPDAAIVMSSGKGGLSRLYKTTDGCKTWKLVFTNPEKEGFFDSLRRVTSKQYFLLGDPVSGKFSVFLTRNSGKNWFVAEDPGLEADKGDGAFAASNSSLVSQGPFLFFVTGGSTKPHLYFTSMRCDSPISSACAMAWTKTDLPLAGGTPAAGAFSIATRMETNLSGKSRSVIVIVGGVYDEPEINSGTAASSNDGGKTWSSPATPPRGYRSSVAYDSSAQTWITVGPNGTDISRDDGRNWTALQPGPQEASEVDKNWNALSLPFVVGPNGRIGKLRPDALHP
jgi:photosystem II stability/assembly factor-like uncharacterized protein